MPALPSLLDHLRERMGSRLSQADEPSERPVLPLSWPQLEAALPDAGFPHGVVELTAPHSLGGGTTIALAAIHTVQKADPRAWCAWVDSAATLYAPGVVMAGVSLHRLFVVRPRLEDVGRIAVKLARSKAFSVIVIDDALGGKAQGPRSRDVLVRKLALQAALAGSTVLLLTDARTKRPAPLPVALRLELTRAPEALCVKVGKDRYGRGGLSKTVLLRNRPSLHLTG